MQAMGLRKRLSHTGCQSAVIGLSGGLDSTLALLVTVKAYDLLGMEHKNIIAVTMPGFGTTDRTYQNALELARSLGTTLKEMRYASILRILDRMKRYMMLPMRMDRQGKEPRY